MSIGLQVRVSTPSVKMFFSNSVLRFFKEKDVLSFITCCHCQLKTWVQEQFWITVFFGRNSRGLVWGQTQKKVKHRSEYVSLNGKHLYKNKVSIFSLLFLSIKHVFHYAEKKIIELNSFDFQCSMRLQLWQIYFFEHK